MFVDPGRLVDITLPIHGGMLLYPGDRPPEVRVLSSLAAGDSLTASEISFGCHVGTHIDAPAHFIAGGRTVAELGQDAFLGRALVVEFRQPQAIGLQDVVGLDLPKRHHLLIKTANSQLLRKPVFQSDYVCLREEAAQHLLRAEPLSIGFDYYSLDPVSDSSFPAHTIVARAGLPAYVCLDLAGVAPGRWNFIASPLPVVNIEAIPVRAFLSPPE